MTAFLGALAAALIIPFLLGFPVACALRLATGIKRIAWSGVLGLAMLVVVLRSAQYLIPLGGAIWWLTPVLVIGLGYGWGRAAVRRGFRRDCTSLTWLGGVVLVLCVLALAAALNLPILLHHVIAFEGTPNNDSVLYVLNARWMQHHRFFDAPVFQPGRPLEDLVTGFFGSGLGYRRVGAEAFLAYIAELIGKDPVYAYNAVAAAGAIWAGLSGLLIIPAGALRRLRGGFRTGWPYPVFFCTPALLYLVLNSNYACTFGVIFFAAYIAISSWDSSSRWRRAIPAILLLAALAATYPELIPFAWLALAAAILAMLLSRRSLRCAVDAGVRIATEVLITAAVFFWLTISTFYTLDNVHRVVHISPSPWPDIYAGLPALRYIIAVLTTSRSFAEWLPLPLCGLGLLAVAWLVISIVMRRDTRRPIFLGLGAAFVALAVYVFINSFYYGEIKIAEYFAAFVAAVSVVGSAAWQNTSRGVLRIGGNLALALSFLLAVGAGVFHVCESVRSAAIKRVSHGTIALADALSALPAGSTVAIGATPAPYYYAMWFPYLAPRVRFLFEEKTNNGSFNEYVAAHPYAPYDTADYLIESTALPPSSRAEKIVGAYGDFRLVKTGPLAISSGAYAQERNFRWLGQSVTFRVRPGSGRFLDLVLASRFRPRAVTESATILQGADTCVTSLNTRRAAFSIPVHEPHIMLTFRDPAVSPSQFGSRDTRKLTFRLLSMDVSDSPRYPPVNCTANATRSP